MVKFREQIFEVPPKLDGRNVAVEEQAKPLSLKLPNPNWAAKRFSVGPGHRVHHPNRHLRTSSSITMLESFLGLRKFSADRSAFQEYFFTTNRFRGSTPFFILPRAAHGKEVGDPNFARKLGFG
jgi:hypothetical protein